MQDLPHHYQVRASAAREGEVTVTAEGMPDIATAPPAAFGGPGDRWTPEDLLVAAVADCFILSFRGVARAQRLEWTSLACTAVGTLDRVEGQLQFTRFDLEAALVVPEGVEHHKAERALQRAEKGCLITASLRGESHLVPRIESAPA